MPNEGYSVSTSLPVEQRFGTMRVAPPNSRSAFDTHFSTHVWGYFAGGGYAFGLFDNAGDYAAIAPNGEVFDPDNFVRYQALNPSGGAQPFEIRYLNARTGAYLRSVYVDVGTNWLPYYSNLQPVDMLAFHHDYQYQILLNNLHAGNIPRSIFRRLATEVNQQLYTGVRELAMASVQMTPNGNAAEAEAALLAINQNQYRAFIEQGLSGAQPVERVLSAWSGLQSFVQGFFLNAEGKAAVAQVIQSLRARQTNGSLPFIGAAGPQLFEFFGSSLGSLIVTGDGFLDRVSASILNAVGAKLGEGIGLGLINGTLAQELTLSSLDIAVSFDSIVGQSFQTAAVGSLTSYFTLELGEALGLDGFGAELLQGPGGNILGKVVHNAYSSLNLFDGVQGNSAFSVDGLGAGVGNIAIVAMAAFLGAKLGSMVVQPQTQAGAILATVGSAAGAWVGFKIGATYGSWGGPIGTFIGAFVGFVLGALFGNLFGRKPPRVPTANAEVLLQMPNARYELGAVSIANGGNVELVKDMALTARDTLNGFLDLVSRGDPNAKVSNLFSPSTYYGHTGNQIWVKLGTSTAQPQYVSSPDAAVEKGVIYALPATRVVGGDLFMKRALYNIIRKPGSVANLAALMGNLQIASDYGSYLSYQEFIDEAIAEPYESLSQAQKNFYSANKAFIARALAKDEVALSNTNPQLRPNGQTRTDAQWYGDNQAMVDSITADLRLTQFAAAWLITLQRAAELELHRAAPSDFYGGAKGFIDSLTLTLADGEIDYESVAFALQGANNDLNTTYKIVGEATLREFLLPKFLVDVGYSSSMDQQSQVLNNFRNWSGAGAGIVYDDAYEVVHEEGGWIQDPWGNWYWQEPWTWTELVDGGSDILIGSAFADTIRGRSGEDWIDGGGGNDTLYGGDGNDLLLGKAGADALYGDAGDDTLLGGADNDTLYGGAGNDVIDIGTGSANLAYGGDNDDVFLAANGGGTLYGDAGSDTVSYRNLLTPGVWGFPGFFEPSTPGVYFNMNSGARHGAAADDTIANIENLEGSKFSDFLAGNSASNRLTGLAGDDKLWGYGSNDVLEGGAGADELDGGDGVDTASYKSSSAAVWVDWTDHRVFGGDAYGDTFISIENLEGSRFADTFKGNSSANRLTGLGGDDWFIATAGADIHEGGEGFDTVDYGDVASAATVNLATNSGAGAAAGHTFYSIEHIFGSAFADSITMSAADETITGGRGNDALNGAAGSDTYIFYRGDGADTITETNAGSNALVFADSTWDQVWVQTPVGGALIMGIGGTSDQMSIATNFSAGNNKIKSIEMGGAGSIDVSLINWTGGGTTGNDTLFGGTNRYDWIWAGAGNDTIRGAANANAVESYGNIIVGGQGNDTIFTSAGDDQFVFERGHGRDTITDAGGEDTIVIGPTATSEDILFEIVGGDLYIGLRNPSNANQTASQVADYIKIVGGGTKWVGMVYGYTGFNTIEYIRAGGLDVRVTGLDLAWTTQYYYDGPIPPIVFDLGGDGLDLISLEKSDVVFESEDTLFRVGWVDGQDGLLAIDRNGDGAITHLSEISFISEREGATTDMEGLAGFDSNGDGVISTLDARWGELRLWRDVNQNGRGHGNEVATLDEAGIVSISLNLAPTGFSRADTMESVAVNSAIFTWADGRTGTVYDVMLGAQPIVSAARPGLISEAEFGRLGGEWEALALSRDDAGDGREPLPEVVTKRGTVEEVEAALAATGGRGLSEAAGGFAPIIIDLKGDGIDLIAPEASPIRYDLDKDGFVDQVGWVGASDAILGFDRDGDGRIHGLSELSFLGETTDARSQAAGLAAFDTNSNGVLDASDADFGRFLLWRDLDQDGVSSREELLSLKEAGLVSLSVVSRLSSVADVLTNNSPLNQYEAVFDDGSVREAGGFVLGSRSGLALAAAALDQKFGNVDASYEAENSFSSTAPWALTPSLRRALIDQQRGEASEEFASTPDSLVLINSSFVPERADIADVVEDISEGRRLGKAQRQPAPMEDDLAHTPASAELAKDTIDIGSGLRRTTATRRWWLEGDVGAPTRNSLQSVMERLGGASVLDRSGVGLEREDRAIAQSADTQGQVDALVQAVAALGGAAGGDTHGQALAKLTGTDAALPSAWKRERLLKIELV